MESNRSNARRWVYLALGTLTMLMMGVIYAWSILKAPLGATFGWDDVELSMNYTATFSFFCVGSILGSQLTRRIGLRITLLFSGALIGAGYLLTSIMTSSNVLVLYIFYGALVGMGTGMAYNTTLSAVNEWFPDKRGTCSGILMMGFGFSTLLLGNIIAALFEVPGLGWQWTYRLMGLCTFAVLVLCAFIFRQPTPADGLPAPVRFIQEAEDATPRKTDYTPMEMLRTPSFWTLYVYGVLIGSVGGAVFSFARDLALSLGATAALATALVGVLSAGNGLSRIFVGLLFDRLGSRRTIFLGSLTVLISPALMLLAIFTHSLPIGILGLVITGLAYGYGPVMGSAVMGDFYGTKNFSTNYSINNTKAMLTSFAAPMASALYEAAGTYAAPFTVLLCFAAVAFVLNFFIKRA